MVLKQIPVFVSNRWLWILPLAAWALAAGVSLAISLKDIQQQNHDLAVVGARNMFQMVLLTRLWNASHGGVYVPVTTDIQPNLFLKHSRRDITSKDGMELTMINPAFMTRLIAELAEGQGGIVFHITSLKPLNPNNAPDEWERDSLVQFENGTMETIGFNDSAHDGVLRYMAPLIVQKACMKCHAEQGYHVGDIRGGISVNQSFQPFLKAAAPTQRQTYFVHMVVFLLVALLGAWLFEQLRTRWFQLAENIQELEDTRSELVASEKMASLGRMVAGFAHEINTPIGVAVGAASQAEETAINLEGMLEQEEVLEEELAAGLETVGVSTKLALSNLQRAAELIQSFKRTSVDQSSEQMRRFYFYELIQDVLNSLQSNFKRSAIVFLTNCPQKLELNGIPGIYTQILTNLIMNSYQHAFNRGTDKGDITITVEQPGKNRLRIVYEDNGKGMDEKARTKVFEPFFTTDRGYGGSGLGLYICYNLVTTQLNGQINCDSTVGEGTTFTIENPI